jgi:spore germination protein GerM
MRRVTLFLVGTLGLVGTACGVPTDSSARELPESDVPFALLAAEAPASTTTTVPAQPVDVTVFMIGPDDRLIGVPRQVTSPLAVEKVVAELIKGPVTAERRKGMRSGLAPETLILSASISDNIANIDLGGPVATGTQQLVALAQIVYTATELDGVNGVRFTYQGTRANVLTELGSTAFPVGRAAYPSLAPL